MLLGDRRMRALVCYLNYRGSCSRTCAEHTSRVDFVNTFARIRPEAVERDLLVAYLVMPKRSMRVRVVSGII